MQTTINKKDFINALTIGGAMEGRAKSMPILDYSKFEIKDGILTISSYDFANSISKSVKVGDVDGDFEFGASSLELCKVVKSLTSEVVTFKVEGNTLIIPHVKGKMTLPVVEVDEFPMPSTIDEECFTLDISSEGLKYWIIKASEFVANDELRPALCGMLMYIKDGKVGVCATDAHKLFTDNIDLGIEGEEINAILPYNSFKTLLNLLQTCEKINMKIGSRNFVFSTDDSTLACRMVDGVYPNFRAIIPQQFSISANISKSEIIDSINRVSLFTNKTTSLLKLNIQDDIMSIEAKDDDTLKNAYENIPLKKDGADIIIGAKSDYFLNCLSCINDEDVKITFNSPAQAIVFHENSSPNKVVLLMPMRID